jgi:transposase-like protein
MPSPTCPRCKSENMKAVEVWRVSVARKVAWPSEPMWACRNPSCRYKWPRELAEATNYSQTPRNTMDQIQDTAT